MVVIHNYILQNVSRGLTRQHVCVMLLTARLKLEILLIVSMLGNMASFFISSGWKTLLPALAVVKLHLSGMCDYKMWGQLVQIAV